jgi:hypothetical protein
MTVTTIFFNGRLISVPGSYSEINASGLEVVGLSATGIVACVGEAVGGKPWTEIPDSEVKDNLEVDNTGRKTFDFFKSGDLKEAGPLLFGPSNDDDIQNGAAEVVYVKTNPAIQSTYTFTNTDGDACLVTSRDYGYHTRQIKMAIGTGTNQGKLITIEYEDITETFDDVGGDVMFKIQYEATTPANGFSTIGVKMLTTGLEALFTVARSGKDADITNQVTAGQKIEMVSDDVGDTMNVVIYGTNTSDAAQTETVALTGTTVAESQNTWNEIHGAYIASAPAGTVTIRNLSGGTTITTLTSGAMTKGLHAMSEVAVAGETIAFAADAATTKRLTVVGKAYSGSAQIETIQLNGTTSVPTTGTWSEITYLAMGEVEAARTATASGNAVKVAATGSPTPTIQRAADKFNGTAGWTFTIVTGRTAYLLSDLDYVTTASDVKSPAEPSFYANLALFIEKLNLESELVSAARSTGGTTFPDNTSADVYLSGGHEGSSTPGQEGIPTSTQSDWQGALDLLKKVRVNSIVVLTGDPAVHAALSSHLSYMNGVGRSERDGFVGLLNTAMTDLPTKAEIKSQIIDLNTRYIRAWGQNVERYNTSGEKEVMSSPFGAAILAGMQAGSPVGTSLTWKYMNTLSIEQDASWNPTDDAEEMINAGLVFAEVIDGVGRRVVRNVTTHLTSSNIAYTEGSVVEAVNYAVYNFRTAMERIVGQSGFAGTVTAAKGVAVNQLGLLVGVALVAWRSLVIDLIIDFLEAAVEMAPVLPINFVGTTVHLVTIPQSAAAA